MKTCPKGSFVDLVFRLVIFHQSVEGHPKYPAMVELNEAEKYLFMDPAFYDLLTPLMISDSCSYTIISVETSKKARQEFLKSQ